MGGRDKLLLELDGVPLLHRQAAAALSLGAPVLITLPRGRDRRRGKALGGLKGPLWTREVEGDEGMAASLRAGASWALGQGARALMVMLPDLPGIGAPEIATLAQAFAQEPGRCLRATSQDGEPGHPVILPARLFTAVADLHGDQGARALLARESVLSLPLPGRAAVMDLDTPDAWAAWQTRDNSTPTV
ncbi:CTP:molybdopterin cytidylyltransferase MocA [Rhodovulum bhavnagarense]|uniref:CTP:molybdopterin cytidylyltransferase MocA n=2 Tax=Rhodovulum bhavnagarense TaxID=992286 RepID=A0A4R2RQF2_9RHOB|nr:CTP:molybdopterin cytidylyltransferase MocA [Rhodovulum bhavnagarense]